MRYQDVSQWCQVQSVSFVWEKKILYFWGSTKNSTFPISSFKCQIKGKPLKVLLHNPKNGANFKSRIKFKILHCCCPPTVWVQHTQKVPSWAQEVTSFAVELFWSKHTASIVTRITLKSFHVPFEHTETLTLEMGVPLPPFCTQTHLSRVSLKAPCWRQAELLAVWQGGEDHRTEV